MNSIRPSFRLCFSASIDSAFFVFTPNLPVRAPVASIIDVIPARISPGKCFINSASLWISGSHSAPLAIMNST